MVERNVKVSFARGVAFSALVVAAAVVTVGCEKTETPAAEETTTAAVQPAEKATAEAAGALEATPTGATAEIGKPAPDFTLSDLDGKQVKLSELRGKTVVLEWFNPGCPFVKAAHTEGSLKTLAADHPEVVWLAVRCV